MKTPNKNVTRLVAAVSTVGVITPSLPSCAFQDYEIISSENLPKGISAIELDLTKDELEYLHFMQKLSDDIVKYPIIAQEFTKNPQLFLEKYGYKESINLDDNILKLILALGDEDINKAINVRDVKTVLKLMKEKNLLNNIDNTYSYINIQEEKVKEILSLMGVESENLECYSCVPGICYFGVLVVAVYIAAAVSVAAAGVTAGVAAASWTYIESFIANNSADFLDQNSSLKIWSLKNKANDTHFAVDLYIEEQVNEMIDIVKSYDISFDEEKMKDFLKINILI